jgi:hypothetical protein
MYIFYLFDFFSIFSFGEERENMALGQSKQSNLRRHQRRSKLLSLTCWHLPPTALLRATQILQKESKLLFQRNR